jgi:NADP-dependent 3-hydroxy acid dehydrogenase YdfG
MTIENRVAVITGATGGLGRVVAERFAGQGARLALLSTNADKLSVLAQNLRLPPERWLTHALDLRDPGAVRAAADTVLQRFGQVDMLFNLVGGWIGGRSMVDVAASDVEDMLNQHVWTTFNVGQAFIPPLIANHWGKKH